MDLLWTISPSIRSIAAPWINTKLSYTGQTSIYTRTMKNFSGVNNFDYINHIVTFVTPTARTSTDRLPWTTSTEAFEIGPVQRCCNISLAWSLPNSTSTIIVISEQNNNEASSRDKKFQNLAGPNSKKTRTCILVIPYKWCFTAFKMWSGSTFCEVLKNMLKRSEMCHMAIGKKG